MSHLYTSLGDSSDFSYFLHAGEMDKLHDNHHLIFGIIALTTILIGIPTNILSYLYFNYRDTGRDTTVTLLYRTINSVDALVCFLMIPIMVSSFRDGQPTLFSHSSLCYTWAVLWEISIRMSIFLIGVMSIARTVALVQPLHAPRKCHLMIPIALYFILLVIQETVPLFLGAQGEYHEAFAVCGLQMKDIIDDCPVSVKVYNFFTIDLEFITPLFVIIVSSIVSMVQLMKKSTQSNKYKHEEATKTILILALVYIIFNIPYCTVYVLRSLTLWSNSKIRPILGSMSLPVRYLVYSFILTHTMALNSTVNPLIYFCRLPQLRKFVLQKEGLRESISKSLKIKTRKRPSLDYRKGVNRRQSSMRQTDSSGALSELINRRSFDIRRKSSDIRRKSSDIKLAMVAALAIKNHHTEENPILTNKNAGCGARASRAAVRRSDTRVSFKQTPIPEEEAAEVRRESLIAARAYEKISVNNPRETDRNI